MSRRALRFRHILGSTHSHCCTCFAFSALGGHGTNIVAGAHQLFDVLPHRSSLVYFFCLFIAFAVFVESKEYNLKTNMVGDHVNVQTESKRLSINKCINVAEHHSSIF